MSRETGDGSIGQPAALMPGSGGSGMPREGSRETNEGIIVSVPFDWCKSPTNPVPYTIWARQKDAGDLATTVRQTDNCSHVKASKVLQCHGDEPGTGGGVKSGTHVAMCEPKTWSETVRAEGRNMVRHDDEWWMNNRNTWGRLVYTKDMNAYDTAAAAQIRAMMPPLGAGDEPGTQVAQAYGVPPVVGAEGPAGAAMMAAPLAAKSAQAIGQGLRQAPPGLLKPTTSSSVIDPLTRLILKKAADIVRVTSNPDPCKHLRDEIHKKMYGVKDQGADNKGIFQRQEEQINGQYGPGQTRMQSVSKNGSISAKITEPWQTHSDEIQKLQSSIKGLYNDYKKGGCEDKPDAQINKGDVKRVTDGNFNPSAREWKGSPTQ